MHLPRVMIHETKDGRHNTLSLGRGRGEGDRDDHKSKPLSGNAAGLVVIHLSLTPANAMVSTKQT
jgi:hypothetical protein